MGKRKAIVLLFFFSLVSLCFHTFAEGCDHDFEWYGNEKEHWNMCKKCGYQDEYARGPHWRFCTEEKCAQCGLPYYDDEYYFEHTGVVEKTYYVDNIHCCQVWSCCGLEQLVEHSYPDFGEEFEVVDEKYHSYLCSGCHSRIIGEHSYDDNGECYDCHYVMNGYLLNDENKETNDNDGSLHPGDRICFGNYEQDGDTSNGAEPIEWMVLEADGSKYLLLSVYVLDRVDYSDYDHMNWEESRIRNLLNDEFINVAFSGNELSSILVTDVDNSPEQGDEIYRTLRGGHTKDRVFLLSSKDVERYFGPCTIITYSSDSARSRRYEAARAECSRYYKQKYGGLIESSYRDWWLRSSYDDQRAALIIDDRGNLSYSRGGSGDKLGIRPAIWIDLSNHNDKESSDFGYDSLLRETTANHSRSFKTKYDNFIALFSGFVTQTDKWAFADLSPHGTASSTDDGTILYQKEYEMIRNFNRGIVFKLNVLTDEKDYIIKVTYISPEDEVYGTVLSDRNKTEQIQQYTVTYPASCLSALTGEELETSKDIIQRLLQDTANGNLPIGEFGSYVIYRQIKCSLSQGTNGAKIITFSVADNEDNSAFLQSANWEEDADNNTGNKQNEYAETSDPSNVEVGTNHLIGKTNRNKVNLRAEMDKRSTLLNTIKKKGTPVTILSDSIGADNMVWYQVEYEGIKGYIRSDFITIEERIP